MEFINIADIKNPKTGKTYREENLEKTHNIPIGALVEVEIDDDYLDEPKHGLRLFVVSHDRDCDGSPLYSLSFNKNWKEKSSQYIPKIAYRMQKDSGYSESCLKLIKI